MSVSNVCTCVPSTGPTGWVKSDPLGPAELRGHFGARELLDADMHQLAAPDVRAWSQAYRDDGLLGTDVSIVYDGLPAGVSTADNQTGTRIALANLAALFETPT